MFELLFIFIFGTIIGSFLNAVIWRIHVSQSVMRGRSKCVHCEHELSAGDLIPLVNFVLLRGKCRYCKKPISWQYPLVELGMGMLFILSYIIFLAGAPEGVMQALFLGQYTSELIALARLLLFLAVLVVLFVYDARWGLLPDSVTLPAIPIAFIINLFVFSAPVVCGDTAFVCFFASPWSNMLLAALIGGGFFAFQYVISRGVWIGGGDIRLGALMGVMLGFPGILYALFIAYIVGACVAVVLLALRKKGMKSEIPFGPFLCGATAVMLLYGDSVVDWFGRLFNL
ncbi:MAG: prepilin peptidase [Candidatus Uhrbacteria bacterium]|nr:prepilin peptidase [Candidatus Uhrbacteria bacterium]